MGQPVTVDQNVQMPDAARRQIEAAQRMHAEIYGKPGDAPSEVPPAAPAPDAAAGQNGSETPPVERRFQTTVEDAQTPPQQSETPPAPDNYKQQYDTLKGKYNREVPLLNDQVRTLTGQVEALQQLLSQMQSAPPPTPAPTEPVVNSAITQKDVEEFGEETIDFVRRAVRAESEATIGAMQRRINELESRLAGTAQAVQLNERQKVQQHLDRTVQNWRTVNTSVEFKGWLQEPDTYSGMPRQALLTRAYENGDAARVEAFFKGFLNEHAVVEPPSAQQAPATPQRNLETLVAPGTVNTAPVRAQGDGKRNWTRQEISKFFADKRNGRFVGREAEAARIERDIFEAGHEGRIQA